MQRDIIGAVTSCGIVPPSLEDVFLDVAERKVAA